MRRIIYIFICSMFFCCRDGASSITKKEKMPEMSFLQATAAEEATGEDGPLKTDSQQLVKKINLVYKRATAGGYSLKYALLADLGLHSGSRRLYFVNLTTKKIIQKALVTHGSSTTYLPNGQRQYSNVEGSLCSSLGLYKIGGAYQGTFGLAYKLYGLDADNSNAYARAVVLHSHSCVPDEETDEPICQSWGCPTISPAFLKTVASYIDASQKPMLLYMFDSSEK